MDETSRAARCELRRAGLNESGMQFVRWDPAHGSHAATVLRSNFDKLGGSTERLTVAVSLGNHYNDDSANPRDSSTNTTGQSRSDFSTHVRWTLQLLETLAASCRQCNVAFLTAHAQHFDTQSGAFAGTWRRDADAVRDPDLRQSRVFIAANASARSPNLTYGCRALRPPLSPKASNSWRGATALAEAEQTPNVLTIPLHRISRLWWGAHIGIQIEALCARKYSHGCPSHKIPWTTPEDRYVLPDCTHHCHSPFLYQPVWWALAKGAIAARERRKRLQHMESRSASARPGVVSLDVSKRRSWR